MPWYYYRSGRREGPIDDAVFRRMAADGQLEPTDFVWSPGMKEWAEATTIPALLQPPPLPDQGHAEEEKSVIGKSPVVPVPSPPPLPGPSNLLPQSQGTPSGEQFPERSRTRAARSSQPVQEKELARPIAFSKDGKCPQCAFLLPKSALFLRDYRCPACGTLIAFASNQAAHKSDEDEKPSIGVLVLLRYVRHGALAAL